MSKDTRKILCFVFASFSILALFSANVVAQKELAYDFTVTDIDGNTFTLSDHRGKVVLIDFVHTDCFYCQQMQGELKQLRNHFSEQELVMISISTYGDDTEQDVRDFKTDFGGDWTYAKDPQDLGTIYGITGTPTEYIIDVNGYIHVVRQGYRPWTDLVPDIEAAMTGYEPPDLPPPAINAPAPEFTLLDIDGNEFNLSEHKGAVVLIDFFTLFATTPSACKENWERSGIASSRRNL